MEAKLSKKVDSLTGIGKQTALYLQKLGIYQVQDLLFHLPVRYEDKTRIYPISLLSPMMTVLVCGQIETCEVVGKSRQTLVCQVRDTTGIIYLRFFNYTARQMESFQQGRYLSCFGEIKDGYYGLEIVHPEYKLISSPEACITEDCLSPIYPLTEGVHQTILRKAIKQALQIIEDNPQELIDWLPSSLLTQLNFPDLVSSLHSLHAPSEDIPAEVLENGSLIARKRLAFEEFLAHHLSLQQLKQQHKVGNAPLLTVNPADSLQFLQRLPFKLTNAQQRVIKEIEGDCQQNSPMIRLIQGDVGSGKTIVAAYAALLALSSNYQVAIMAPTELLAEQHRANFEIWFNDENTHVVFLTGSIKGKARLKTLEAMADGSAHIIIGTHALFQDGVNFQRLGLIVIDEQHRFGVHQRLALREKGANANNKPHQLVMTATPIPRTLAMLRYSDMDISIIDELPPGRKTTLTCVMSSEKREQIIERITHWVAQQKQVYWVCTLIDESEVLQCEAAENTQQKLINALPNIRIGLVHGRMKSNEKESVMLAFKQGELDLLVATTVIEVGVDVPNAGLMIIENPERLGLSQLHQLRGRVGRGADESYCLLVYQPPLSLTAKQRLSLLRETSDGFIIAEKDLELRGQGELFGTRQTGQQTFKIADLSKDGELIPFIESAALQLQQPAINQLINRWQKNSHDYAEV